MLEPQGDAAGLGGWERAVAGSAPLYTRTMPGGGSVRVELVPSAFAPAAGERRRGRVVIEPRSTMPRRADTAPLVVEEVEGEDENAVVAELFRIARDNAAIARRVLRRRSTVARGD